EGLRSRCWQRIPRACARCPRVRAQSRFGRGDAPRSRSLVAVGGHPELVAQESAEHLLPGSSCGELWVAAACARDRDLAGLTGHLEGELYSSRATHSAQYLALDGARLVARVAACHTARVAG